jgi:hypothetical protein
MTLGVDCAIDMVEEAKLPEHGVEEGTPCREGVAVVKAGSTHASGCSHAGEQ